MNLQFTSTKDKLPQDGEYILYIKVESSMFHTNSPMPTFAKCEWSWSDGDGGQLCYSEGDDVNNPPSDYPLLLILDGEGYIIWTNETNKWNPEIEHIWWMKQEDFDNVWKQNI